MRICARSLVLTAALLGAVLTTVNAESKGLRGQKPSTGSGSPPTDVVLDALGSVNVDDTADKRIGDGQLLDRVAGYQPLQPGGGRRREDGPMVPPDGSMIDTLVERVREVREGWEDRTLTRPTQNGNTQSRTLQEVDKRLGDGQLFDRAAGYQPLQPGGGRPREDGPVVPPDGSMIDSFVERVREVREGWEDRTMTRPTQTGNTEGRKLQEADKRLGDGQLFDRVTGYQPLQPGGGRPREDGPIVPPDGSMMDSFVERVREVREGWEDRTMNLSSRSSNEVSGDGR